MRRNMHGKNMINKHEKRCKVLLSIATVMVIISMLSAFFIAFTSVTLAAPLTDVTATPTDNTAGVTTTYIIHFTTVKVLNTADLSDHIVITFLAGFNASGATVDGATVTQSGSDPTLASTTMTIVTLNVTAKENAGPQSIVLNGIINTQTAGTEKTVTVETQEGNNAYVTLDGPTASEMFEISAGAVATLTIQTQPTDAIAGVAISPVVKAQAVDAFGNVVSGAPVMVMLQTGPGTLSGATPQTTDALGNASFNDLSINLVGVNNVLQFSSNGHIVDSVTFTISAAAVATLTVQIQPSAAVTGMAIAPPIEIVAKDAFTNGVPGVSVVAAQLNGTGVLSGSTTQSTNSSGVAIFNDLSINLVGIDKTLRFTTGAVGVNSSVFTISAASNPSSPPSGGGSDDDTPTANAGGPYTGVVGTPVQFSGSQSTAVEGRYISYYSWSFGDGTTSEGVISTHTYLLAGNYTIRLNVTDTFGTTDTASTSAIISSITSLVPSVTVLNQTWQDIETAYGVILEQPFYASDTNGDGIVDIFTDPNNRLKAVSLVNISGHPSFLISTNNDDIPEFFWDTSTNIITSITHTPVPLTAPLVNTTEKTVTLKITVNKTGWIYLDIPDQYPIDDFPQYNFTVKTENRTISSDMIWRKNGKIYILDDPAISYDFIWGYTILPPTFSPLSGTTLTTVKPTITITYSQQVSLIIALLDEKDIIHLCTTTDNTVFTFIPITDLTGGTYAIRLTVLDDQGKNPLTSTATYTISLPKQQRIDVLWIIVTIIAIALIVSITLVFLYKHGYI
jgi:hypothetical protein